jgi:glucose-1-phosphatase
MSAMIKAIIFDLGKVIFDTSFYRCLEFWSKVSDKSFDEIKSKFSFDGIYENFERNVITPSQFRKQLSEKLGLDISDELFDQGWCSIYLDTYPGIESHLKELKKNYRLIALSNTNSIHEKVWSVKYASVLQHFEKVFSSHHMRTRKPEATCYLRVLKDCNLNVSEVIFLDDNAGNTEGAKKLGIHSVLVSSTDQMITELEEILKGSLEH